jgi:thiamine-phosphate pyrophosphorylase
MRVATEIGGARRAKLAAARLYLICDSEPAGRTLEALLRAALAGGADLVQLRDKRLGPQELTDAARRAAAVCHELGALLLVNDDPQVALAAGADGVHVGQEDMPVEEVRELVGRDLLVGLSTHAPAEVDAASAYRGGAGSADYIGVGPVFATPTKAGRAAVGAELVRHAAAAGALPFFAVGGIDGGNLRKVLEAGARRVAVVRAIASATNPEAAARELRAELDQVAVERADRAAAAA